MRSLRRSQAGFTLLDLLISLTAISVVATAAIAAYFASPGITLEQAAILLARDLRAAQNRSAFLGSPCEFVFHESGYEVVDSKGLLITNPRTNLAFDREYSRDGVFEGVRIKSLQVGGDGRIRFDNHGVCGGGGQIVLSFRDSERHLAIEPGSGTISIPDSSSGWRDLGH